MHIIKLSAIAATVFASAVFATQFATASDLQPGKGWDAFNARNSTETEVLTTEAFIGTSMASAPGQGYDTMHARDGAPIVSNQGASTGLTGQGYDTFHAKDGEPL